MSAIRVIGLLMALASTPVTACDALYLSPLAVSHHWGAGDWNEVHPGITLECRAGRFAIAAGRMRNSIDRHLRLVMVTAIFPLNNWVGMRIGAAAGRYEGAAATANFIAPILTLTLAEGRRIGFDLTHAPAGGPFSPVPVTVLALRLKLYD